MTRLTRTLLTSGSAADPPEAVVTVESDFVVILAALLCALVSVIGLIAVARCTFLRRAGSNNNRTSPAANKGVKKKVLNSLPKFTYATTTTPDSDGGVVECAKFALSECVICIGEFSEGDEIRVLPQCGHGFHVDCIDTWLGSHSSCPSCRQILVVTRCRNCGHFPDKTSPSSCSSSSSSTVDGGASHKPKTSKETSNSNSSNVNSDSFLP